MTSVNFRMNGSTSSSKPFSVCALPLSGAGSNVRGSNGKGGVYALVSPASAPCTYVARDAAVHTVSSLVPDNAWRLLRQGHLWLQGSTQYE